MFYGTRRSCNKPYQTIDNVFIWLFCQTLWVLIFQMHFYLSYREVFKARDKKNKNLMVALKKVLMENEKEGVSKNKSVLMRLYV